MDARASYVKRVEVLPDYQKPAPDGPAPIAFAPRRKGKVEIMSEIDATYGIYASIVAHYPCLYQCLVPLYPYSTICTFYPPITCSKAELAARRPKKTKGGDRSKAKHDLQHQFRFNGGKALPKAGLMPALSKDESDKLRHSKKIEKLSQEEILFDKIVQEIEERQQFITQMNEVGDYSKNLKIKREIKDRHEELLVLKKLIDRQKKSRKK